MLRARPDFLRNTRKECRPLQSGRRPRSFLNARLRDALFQFGHPLLLLVAIVAPIFPAWLQPGPRHFAWACMLYIGTAHVAGLLANSLFNHPHLLPLALYPARDPAVFNRQFQLALRPVAGLAIALGTGFGIARSQIDSPNLLRNLLCGLLMAGFFPLFALSYSFASFRWHWLGWPMRLALPLSALLLVIVKAVTRIEELIHRLLISHGDLLTALLPTGWVVLPWAAAAGSGAHHLLFALPPLLVVLAHLPVGFAHLRFHYRFRDAVLLNVYLEVPDEAEDALADAVHAAQAAPGFRGRTAVLDDLETRRFLAPQLPEPSAPIERWVWRWWSSRERLVAEFLRREWPAWTHQWKIGSLILVASLVSLFVLHRFTDRWHLLALIGFGIGLLFLLPWAASFNIEAIPLPGPNILFSPLHAVPIHLAEVALLQLKAVVIRSLVALPILASTGSAILWILRDNGPLWSGAAIGAQLALFPIVARPLLTVYRFHTVLGRWMPGFIPALAFGLVILAALLTLTALILSFIPLLGLIPLIVVLALNSLTLRITCRLLASRGIDAVQTGTG
jgi:hypothetical protein